MNSIYKTGMVVLLLTTILAVGFALMPKRPDPELERLKGVVDSLTKERDRLKGDKTKLLAEFAKEREGWEQESKKLQAKLAEVRSPKTVVDKPQATKAASGNLDLSKVPQEDLRKAMRDQFLNDPERMKEAKQNARRMIDQYGGLLLKKLKLDTDSEDKFKDLWAERGIYWFTGRFNGGDKQTQAEMEAKVQAIDAQVASLLGNQYGIYEDYNLKQMEYMQVNGLQGSLGEENMMTDEQADSLATAIYDIRQSNPVGNWWELGGEERAKAEEKRKENDQKILEQAKSFLNETQLKALEQSMSNRGRWGGGFGR